jgi:hypothetical protein
MPIHFFFQIENGVLSLTGRIRKEIKIHCLDTQDSVEMIPWRSADSEEPSTACINS